MFIFVLIWIAGHFDGTTALAQGEASEPAAEVQLAPVEVTGTAYSPLDLAADTPSNTESKTAEALRQQNLFNPEDALRYVPSLTVRKRYIGDRNALVGGRDFGSLQPSRALVYVDDYLISNFLGRFDAPRWNMVTPEAIERVDLLYGPYSALFPGNSIGSTVVITERVPSALEGSVRVSSKRGMPSHPLWKGMRCLGGGKVTAT
jgi:iron complex outermembrane receptor protein